MFALRTLRTASVLGSRIPLRPFTASAVRPAAVKLPSILTQPLKSVDPDIFDIIEQEKRRQRDSVALIPSEVCCACVFIKVPQNFSTELHFACCSRGFGFGDAEQIQ